MARPLDVRWLASEAAWCSDCGEIVPRKDGRGNYRKRVFFRVDIQGPIPYGSKPSTAAWRPQDYPSYARARACLEAYLLRFETEAVPDPLNPTWTELSQAYADWLKTRVRTDRMEERSRRSSIEGLLKWIRWVPADGERQVGYRKVSEVGPELLQGWIDELALTGGKPNPDGSPTPASPNYVARLAGSVLTCVRWAVTSGRKIAVNPLADVKRPKGNLDGTGRRPDAAEVRSWHRRQWGSHRRVRKYVKHDQPWWDRVALLLIRAILAAGCRPDEMCVARWDELDWDTMTFVREKHKTGRKTRKLRFLVLPERFRRPLRLLQRHGHPVWVFPHRQVRPRKSKTGMVRQGDDQGEPWDLTALATKIARAEAPFQLYDLRREWFSSAADSGLTYDQASDLAGNSPVIAKRVYAKRAVESLKRDAARVKPAGTGLKRQG